MKNKRINLFIIFALIVILAISFRSFVMDFFDIPISNSTQKIMVSIPQGATASDIAKILKENNLIRSEKAFKIKVRMSKYKNSLNFGKFLIAKNTKITDIIKLIGENQYSGTYKVTIPEGYSIEQIASIIANKGFISKDEFLKALSDSYNYDFIVQIPNVDYKYKLQGFLFPDTYEFYETSTAHEIIDKMLSEFNQKYLSFCSTYDNIFNIITKASIIEKEAKLDFERSLVAGVIENRLSSNMPLQIDACVVYAITNGAYDVDKVFNKDLKIDSPYNTYLYKGLPVGPICNPGLSSIKAALNPAKHKYLYYHTDESKNDGSHIFTETFSSHIDTMN